MNDYSYRVITRLEQKPEYLGLKRINRGFENDCGIACTGSYWPKPCKKEKEYKTCDECICNYCKDCKCEIVSSKSDK